MTTKETSRVPRSDGWWVPQEAEIQGVDEEVKKRASLPLVPLDLALASWGGSPKVHPRGPGESCDLALPGSGLQPLQTCSEILRPQPLSWTEVRHWDLDDRQVLPGRGPQRHISHGSPVPLCQPDLRSVLGVRRPRGSREVVGGRRVEGGWTCGLRVDPPLVPQPRGGRGSAQQLPTLAPSMRSRGEYQDCVLRFPQDLGWTRVGRGAA